MVKRNEDKLDKVLRALSDVTRRDILEQLGRSSSPITVGELAKPHSMSLPAISKHLDYLEDAGLIKRSKKGREVMVSGQRRAIEELKWWLAEQLHFWK